MYEVLKTVISAGGYKLTEIQHKVKKLFVYGDLTEEQMDELLTMASRGISVDAERPETLALIQTLSAEIKALEARVKNLEGADESEPEQPTYEKWEKWNGISDKYQYGAIVSHIGGLWLSNYHGQNVWEPGAPGTENLWVKYKVE